MAYLYRHIRLDKNEPFYVGIGSDDAFKRAYDKRSRSGYWKNVVNKTPYEVEIVLDGLTWEEACEREKEFIKLYGRQDLNEGILVNMTDGGDGMLGVKVSQERINRFVDTIKREVIQYDMDGNYIREYESATEAQRITKINGSQITSNCKGRKGKKSAGGYVWRYKDPQYWFDPKYTNNKNSHCYNQKHQKPVVQYDMNGSLLAEYISIRHAEREVGVFKTTISKCCRGIYKHAGGFKWAYKNN